MTPLHPFHPHPLCPPPPALSSMPHTHPITLPHTCSVPSLPHTHPISLPHPTPCTCQIPLPCPDPEPTRSLDSDLPHPPCPIPGLLPCPLPHAPPPPPPPTDCWAQGMLFRGRYASCGNAGGLSCDCYFVSKHGDYPPAPPPPPKKTTKGIMYKVEKG